VTRTDYSCDFCTEGRSGQINPEFAAAVGQTTRIVHRLASLYVVPTLSPIVKNHVLLIPMGHITSRLQLSEVERDSVAAAESHLRMLLASPARSIVTFEHGIGKGMRGGCGISHFHIHMLPLKKHVAKKALNLLSQSSLGELADDVLELRPGDSYVYMRSDSDNTSTTLVRRGEFPSQFLRNLIEDAVGITRTNWREIVRSELLRETLMAPQWN
jgi:diadenosine tetraphosphate (Ap4A) HIT family hydrolase